MVTRWAVEACEAPLVETLGETIETLREPREEYWGTLIIKRHALCVAGHLHHITLYGKLVDELTTFEIEEEIEEPSE